MDISIRSWLPAGVAVVTAAAIALVPSPGTDGDAPAKHDKKHGTGKTT
jgi:hypothetical protein